MLAGEDEADGGRAGGGSHGEEGGGEGLRLLTTGEKSSMPEEIAGVEAARRLGEESAAASWRVSGGQILEPRGF